MELLGRGKTASKASFCCLASMPWSVKRVSWSRV